MFPRGKRSPTEAAVRASRNEGVVSNDDVARVYRNEETVAPDSTTEAYLAPRAQGKSWRGAGLPIRLRNRVGRSSPPTLLAEKEREGGPTAGCPRRFRRSA